MAKHKDNFNSLIWIVLMWIIFVIAGLFMITRADDWNKLFLIAGWAATSEVYTTPIDSSYFNDSTSVVLLEFNENMSLEGLRDLNNYVLIDQDSVRWQIRRIGIVGRLDSTIIKDTSVVALLVPRLDYRKEYKVRVTNVKDKAGNFISKDNQGWFFFNGKKAGGKVNININKE